MIKEQSKHHFIKKHQYVSPCLFGICRELTQEQHDVSSVLTSFVNKETELRELPQAVQENGNHRIHYLNYISMICIRDLLQENKYTLYKLYIV